MPRDLGYRDVHENCFFSTYGLKRGLRYAERFVCEKGFRKDRYNGEVQDMRCHDWSKCKDLLESLTMKD